MREKPAERPQELSRKNAKTPDRGQPSGHTPADAAETRSAHRTQEPAGAKNHAPVEKGRPKDTGRGGA
jgi:hypothetical protein